MMDGHAVLVDRGAGWVSGFSDDMYLDAEEKLLYGPDGLLVGADLAVKVKEPQVSELSMLRPRLVLFTYPHLAGAPRA